MLALPDSLMTGGRDISESQADGRLKAQPSWRREWEGGSQESGRTWPRQSPHWRLEHRGGVSKKTGPGGQWWRQKLSINVVLLTMILHSRCYYIWASSSDGKDSTCNAGDPGSIPGSERSPGEGNSNSLQYSCLENPVVRGSWQSWFSFLHSSGVSLYSPRLFYIYEITTSPRAGLKFLCFSHSTFYSH